MSTGTAIEIEGQNMQKLKQESRAIAKKPRNAAAVLFGLKFADNILYNFKSRQASKAGLQSSNISAGDVMQQKVFYK